MNQIKSHPKLIKYILILVVLFGIVFVGIRILSSRKAPKPTVQGATSVQKHQDINKEFTFPVDTNTKMKFVVENAELDNQIVIKGQEASAVPGRTFLIISLKITNDFNQSIQINTRDYVRLTVNKNENELLAPDIHNDPVEVQAISTKYTRVGFPVNTSDHDFVLQIGEIKGDKQKISLNL